MITHIGPEFDTFISARGKGRPDIIIGNRNAHHNFIIQQGPLTTSDHIPIVFTLSTSPIMIPQKETHNINRADWDLFKNEINEQMNEQDMNGEVHQIIDKEYIDQNIDSWYHIVGEAMGKAIPKKKYLTLPHPVTSQRMKLLQFRYKNILNIVDYLGWTPLLRSQYIELQGEINEENRIMYHNHWNEVLKKVEIQYNNPKKFWSSIKRLTGGSQPNVTYITDEGNNKIFDSKEKEVMFRRYWETVFRIDPEDNEEFDRDHEQEIENSITDNVNRTEPNRHADLSRLEAK